MDGGSNHSDLYKTANKSSGLKQIERRKFILSEQRRQRQGIVDDRRGFAELIETLKDQKVHHNKKSAKRNYRNYLQLSEWLKERPDDLSNWYLVPCPRGSRCIVIASEGGTEVFSKFGVFVTRFRSALPGDKIHRHFVTILDCIYTKETNEYWVLDVLAYANQDVINCDVSFRFFWIANKVQEDDLTTVSHDNEFAFKALPFVECDNEMAMNECLAKYPMWEQNQPELDGLLFYHRESLYVHGTTPLVGWLFPFMLPEVFDFVQIHRNYWALKPKEYSNYQQYIEQFDAAAKQKQSKRRRRRVMAGGEGEEMISDDFIDEFSTVDVVLSENRSLELNGGADDEVRTMDQ